MAFGTRNYALSGYRGELRDQLFACLARQIDPAMSGAARIMLLLWPAPAAAEVWTTTASGSRLARRVAGEDLAEIADLGAELLASYGAAGYPAYLVPEGGDDLRHVVAFVPAVARAPQ